MGRRLMEGTSIRRAAPTAESSPPSRTGGLCPPDPPRMKIAEGRQLNSILQVPCCEERNQVSLRTQENCNEKFSSRMLEPRLHA